MQIKLVIPLVPVTKKNHQRILINQRTKKPFIKPSIQYEAYENESLWGLKRQYKDEPINTSVNVKALYYMPTRRRVDLINLHEALHDVLVKAKILEDDNCKIIVSTDGSRVLYDRNNPRTEVIIAKAEGADNGFE